MSKIVAPALLLVLATVALFHEQSGNMNAATPSPYDAYDVIYTREVDAETEMEFSGKTKTWTTGCSFTS
jgi:hypothetical protein